MKKLIVFGVLAFLVLLLFGKARPKEENCDELALDNVLLKKTNDFLIAQNDSIREVNKRISAGALLIADATKDTLLGILKAFSPLLEKLSQEDTSLVKRRGALFLVSIITSGIAHDLTEHSYTVSFQNEDSSSVFYATETGFNGAYPRSTTSFEYNYLTHQAFITQSFESSSSLCSVIPATQTSLERIKFRMRDLYESLKLY